MKLIHLKALAEILRISGHYQCEVQGMCAENLHADVNGEAIPYRSQEFKELSHKYHNKLEKVIKDINQIKEPTDA